MALRACSGLYILNSAQGNIRVQGARRPEDRPGQAGLPRQVQMISKTFRMWAPIELDQARGPLSRRRLPDRRGHASIPGPSPDGEGIYPIPTSGWAPSAASTSARSSSTRTAASTTPRNVTIQTVCARGQVPENPTPHKTVFIRPGETKSATARCPKGQQLITGGFQRTNFTIYGGNYITESRAVGPNAWRVTGSAFGTAHGSGELTAIAYCVRHKGPILTETVGLGAALAALADTRRRPRRPARPASP